MATDCPVPVSDGDPSTWPDHKVEGPEASDSYPESGGGGSEEVDQETKSKALVWCRSFLSGAWRTITAADFQIGVMPGGLTNLLYTCSLPDHIPSEGEEPRRVLLRLYGAILQGSGAVQVESVTFAIMSERAVGPRLYGVFPQGRLEQYVPHVRMRTVQLSEPAVSAEIACKMARFHGMVMPIDKEPRWLFETIDTYMDQALKLRFEPEARAKYNRLLKLGLPAELKKLRELLVSTPSPVVFCHNDVHEGNLLLLKGQDGSTSSDRLMLIDYEYSSYNYRGYDFGNHFCEWMYDYSCSHWPFYVAKQEDYPTREQQLHFIRSYVAEQRRGRGGGDSTVPQEEEEEMLAEANRYALASHFLWGLWSIVQASISSIIEFGYLDYAERRFADYFRLKKLINSDSTS